MDRVAPLHGGQFLLAGNPSRKGVRAICDLELKARPCALIRALRLHLDLVDVFHMLTWHLREFDRLSSQHLKPRENQSLRLTLLL